MTKYFIDFYFLKKQQKNYIKFNYFCMKKDNINIKESNNNKRAFNISIIIKE